MEGVGSGVNAGRSEREAGFPRATEQTEENLKELEQLVLRTGSAVGLAVDPDVDRLALVSNEGKAIGEDYTLALAARLVLRHRKGPLVTNLSTSRLLEDVGKEAGVPVKRAPVGEVNVAPTLRDMHSPIGGGKERRGCLPPVVSPRRRPLH